MTREYRYRLADSMVQKAKELIAEDGDWENYADVERCISKLERGREYIDIILHEELNGTLK